MVSWAESQNFHLPMMFKKHALKKVETTTFLTVQRKYI